MQELLSVKQAAERLQLTKITVYRLIKMGELPACRVGLKKVYIPVDWLEDYLEQKRLKVGGVRK